MHVGKGGRAKVLGGLTHLAEGVHGVHCLQRGIKELALHGMGLEDGQRRGRGGLIRGAWARQPD